MKRTRAEKRKEQLRIAELADVCSKCILVPNDTNVMTLTICSACPVRKEVDTIQMNWGSYIKSDGRTKEAERKAQVQQLSEEGFTLEEIADKLGMKTKNKKVRVDTNEVRTKRDLIVALKDGGMSYYAIAKELGLTHPTVIWHYKKALKEREGKDEQV